MGMFFVDIENVGFNKGLRYVEYLCNDDKLFLFYSNSCANVENDIINKILNSGCELHCYHLEQSQKDANDCRIICEISYYLGLPENEGDDFIIISNDKIFGNIVSFYENHPDEIRRRKIRKCPDLINAIMTTTDNQGKERRRLLSNAIRTTSIDGAYERYKASVEHRNRIKNAFGGSNLEYLIPDICDLFEEKRQGRELYLSAIKLFGKVDGTTVYRKLKNLTTDNVA